MDGIETEQKRIKKDVAAVRSRLIALCERVENGDETTKAEEYFYRSLAYFQEGKGNESAINEFLNVAAAAQLI
ncbi:MAG: hypothetical protein IJY62_03110 [Clostridia bacterium]|nr:hypothetical protein [Clostridia bacterium]